MDSLVQPNDYVFLRLPSDSLRVEHVVPNTTISLGKYGSFSTNYILSRPYNLTYELLDKLPHEKDSRLRIVPASELHTDTIAEENAASNPGTADGVIGGDGVEFQLVGEDGSVLMRSNREIIDSSARQTLTMEEIEELKREGKNAGQDIIAKLMASHLGMEQKTAFSLAKYKLLKTKKYLRRFTILKVDVPMLTRWMMEEKDAGKVLELREEMLALIGSWANVHFSSHSDPLEKSGRWLCVDETGGLLVAAMAERMGILHPEPTKPSTQPEHKHPVIPPANSNTITLIHNNAQPNLSLLQFFEYSPTSLNTSPTHPLSTNLHCLSWLQLLDPMEDITYSNPVPPLSPTTLQTLKSNKRGAYHKKQRRYARVRDIVDTTLAGGFDGLAVASHMDPLTVLKPLLPLLRGGAPVVVYTPTVEPLLILADVFSTSRRTAFIQAPPQDFLEFINQPKPLDSPTETEFTDATELVNETKPTLNAATPSTQLQPATESEAHPLLPAKTDPATWPGNDDFPLNPTILLNTNVQTARVREWQVLPGRTHPLMTGKGGAEGYLFTAVKVLPAELEGGQKVVARGKFGRKRAVPTAEGVGAGVGGKRIKIEGGKEGEDGGSAGMMKKEERSLSLSPADVEVYENA